MANLGWFGKLAGRTQPADKEPGPTLSRTPTEHRVPREAPELGLAHFAPEQNAVQKPTQIELPVCAKCGATSIVARPEVCHRCRQPYPRWDTGKVTQDGVTATVQGGRVSG